MTNKQKFDLIVQEIEEKSRYFIEKYFYDHYKPLIVYEVTSYKQIDEWQITKIDFFHRNNYNLKPTKKDILEIKKYNENLFLNSDDITFSVKSLNKSYISSTAFKNKDILEKNNLSFIKNSLIEYQNHLRELYEPRIGYISCEYCRKQFPEKEVFKYKIFANRSTYIGNFCSNKCAGYCQMGSEG